MHRLNIEITDEKMKSNSSSPFCYHKIGCVFTIFANGNCINPIIQKSNEFIKVNVEMKQGDILIIDTRMGSKNIVYIHDCKAEPYFNYKALDSRFLQLSYGGNTFEISADENENNIVTQIYYRQEEADCFVYPYTYSGVY